MSAMPDLLYTDVEHELRAGVRKLFERTDPAAALARAESDQPYDLDAWHALAHELGVAALPVDEAYGGAGASWREVAVVAEEVGRAVAAVPFLSSAVVATAALQSCGAGDALRDLAGGGAVVILAVPFSAVPGDAFPTTVRDDDGTLTGTVTSVADARVADRFLVPAHGAGGAALYLVDAAAADIAPLVSMDLTRPIANVTFAGAAGTRVAAGAAAEAALQHGLTAGAAMLASEQLGVAQQCLDTTVAYLKTRYQFGRPVGSFQALKHRLADLWVSLTQARAVARYAAVCLATGADDTATAVALAQSHCSEVAVKAAEECIQMHGGIGFTWEHPAHLYLKRAKTSAIALGTPDRHRAALATLADLPPRP